MTVSNEQLIQWSEAPKSVGLKNLLDKLTDVLQVTGKRLGVKFEVYGQGSFANGTYLDGTSDVDIVIERSFPRLTDIPQSTAQAELEWEQLSRAVFNDLMASIQNASVETNSIKSR